MFHQISHDQFPGSNQKEVHSLGDPLSDILPKQLIEQRTIPGLHGLYHLHVFVQFVGNQHLRIWQFAHQYLDRDQKSQQLCPILLASRN